MRKYTILLIVCWICVLFSAKAQKTEALFLPYTWEQASAQAARENKLVLVEIGDLTAPTEKLLLKHQELVHYLGRQVVAFRIDVHSDEGKDFLPRLWMLKPPRLAFFLPYGDLLESVETEKVLQRPEILRETLEKALEIAAVKRSNSRSIQFARQDIDHLLEKAGREEKLIFAWISREQCQPALWMEKNVFTLDRVADFYHRHFIPVLLSATEVQRWLPEDTEPQQPLCLFLNAQGKLVYKTQGYHSAEALIEAGETALEKAKGIRFLPVSLEQALKQAQSEGKAVFINHYTRENSRREMLRTIFADPETAEFFNLHFISVAREETQPMLLFLDADGSEQHRVTQVATAAELRTEAQRMLEGKGLLVMDRQYAAGERDATFMQRYMESLSRAGREKDASGVALAYLSALPSGWLNEAAAWEVFRRYVTHAHNALFEEVLARRKELYALYGEETVRQKIAEVWVAGANDFVKEGKFDEAGFKAYTKRLRQEKVEGWRAIVRNARMQAAAKTGDWRTFVELAEEKWREEQVSDAELYDWGMMINRECRDEAVRYKAARWFAEEVVAMEQKERQTGKIRLSSYKGFFEKLVNDLTTGK